MSARGSSLFRAEVAKHRADRLHGSVSLAIPVAWQAIGLLLFIVLLSAAAFLGVASYARVATVTGAVTLDKGIATIMPSRSGVVSAIEVSDGQTVRVGTVLARIRAEEDLVGGETAPNRIRKAIAEEDSHLEAQNRHLRAAAQAEQLRLREQIAGIVAELKSLEDQIADQRRMVDVAMADYENVRRIAARGFISRRDTEARQTTLLSRRQQLAQLEQLRASKSAAVAEARRAIAKASATAEAQLEGAQSQRASLSQQLAQADQASGYSITSPVDGTITALTVRLGQAVNQQQQLMMVVPAAAEPRVELYVPTAAVGFLRVGQPVRVAIDAFPYQQFGTVPAEITDISGATIAKPGASDAAAVYLVTAKLSRPWIEAFGRRQNLASGMTLSARIVTDSRSLIGWLLQPIFAVHNR